MASIGEAARLSGLPIGTIRFYERTGVVPAPPRTAAGRRDYDAAAVALLRVVRRCRALGFPLPEAAAMAGSGATLGCADVGSMARARAAALRASIAELTAQARRLEALAADCAPGRSDCPALEAIARGADPRP